MSCEYIFAVYKAYYSAPRSGVNSEKIAFTGDLGFSSKYFKDTYARADLLDPILVDYLSDTDYTVVNVEGCINNGNCCANKRLVHANPPECLPFLQKINSNIWALANNHISDCGKEGIENTLQFARENGVQTVGIGLNMSQAEKPIIIKNDGADIGIIAVTQEETEEATENSAGCVLWDNDEKIAQMIFEIKRTCRFCIIIVHSGPEFCQLMPPTVRKQYKKYLDFGADIVVGHILMWLRITKYSEIKLYSILWAILSLIRITSGCKNIPSTAFL